MTTRLPWGPMLPRRLTSSLLVAAAAVTLLTACGSDEPAPFSVGSDGTAAMRVAAELYAGSIARTGVRVEVRDDSRGDRRLLDDAAQGDLDLFPAFTGDLLVTLTPAPTASSTEDVEQAVSRALPQGVVIGDPAAVSNRRQVVLSRSLMDTAGVTDLADCGALPPGMPLATTGKLSADDRAAFGRCRFGAVEEGLTPAEVVARVSTGRQLGALTGLEAASALSGNDAVTGLRSAESGPMAQDLVPVYRSAQVGKSQMKALSRVAGDLTTTDLAEMAAKVEKGADPAVVAREWLVTRGT